MTRKCAVCGGGDADILCGTCYRFVCEKCYNVDADACIKCACIPKARRELRINPSLLVAGFGLIMLGLVVVAWAMTPSTASFVFFPFFFAGTGRTAAFIMSMVFFVLFTLSTLLPVYLTLRRGGYTGWDEEIYTIQDGTPLGNFSETIEYMITTEIPRGLKGSIYIEEDDDRLRLLSNRDNGFVRVYDIPSNCLVDDVESDYEGSYLLVKVRLRKTH
ncbi:MAG TPA: hypothetical protein VMW03_08715 [Candidatus Krumholzibacteriaceae bacterium]|nr:hypothetical protein [Candidatus Krumholzibacteriaceae bacterium]